MSEPNPMINAAATLARAVSDGWNDEALAKLNEAKATSWGRTMFADNPEFEAITDKLATAAISDSDRVRLIDQLESLHTFSGIINRTRRRDIGTFTTRKSETCLLYTSPSPRDQRGSRMPSSA